MFDIICLIHKQQVICYFVDKVVIQICYFRSFYIIFHSNATKENLTFEIDKCPLCTFTNTDNKDFDVMDNFFAKNTFNVNYCFGKNKINKETYLKGKSNFTLENNILLTRTEVCFSNTIISCITYCFVTLKNEIISNCIYHNISKKNIILLWKKY